MPALVFPRTTFVLFLPCCGVSNRPPRARSVCPRPCPPSDSYRVRKDTYWVRLPLATYCLLPSELIGFSQGAEMEVASYRSKAESPAEKRAMLVAITYPTWQIAREQFAMVQKQLRMNEG